MKQLLIAALFVSLAVAGHRGSLIQRVPEGERARANPFDGDERAARAGAKLFGKECSACHGKTGEGNRKAPPLRSAEISGASPGSLFWVLRNGSPSGGMPSFSNLPEPQRWQIVTYLKQLQ